MKARKPLPLRWIVTLYVLAAILVVSAVAAFTMTEDITTTVGAVTVVLAGPDDAYGVVAVLLAVILAALAGSGRRTTRE